MSQNSNYSDLMLEEMKDQNKKILEALQPMSQISNDVAQLKEDVYELKADVKVIKAAVTDQSKQLRDHEHRLITLETA